MTFKELILSIELSHEEHRYFIHICSNWALYCESLANFNRLKILRLLNYLVQNRPASKRLLARCIGRFNRLNALRRDMLE